MIFGQNFSSVTEHELCRRMADSGCHGSETLYEKGPAVDELYSLGNCGGPTFVSVLAGKSYEPDSKQTAAQPLHGPICPSPFDYQWNPRTQRRG